MFELFLEFQNRFDASGGFAGLATLRGPGVNSTNNLVIVNRPAGSALTVFAREGDPIPGAPPGLAFDFFAAGCASQECRGSVLTVSVEDPNTPLFAKLETAMR